MIYTYACPECHKVHEVARMVDERDLPYECDCGAVADRIFNPGTLSISCDGEWAHTNTNWGVDVRGKQHWQDEMKKRGEVPFEHQPETKEVLTRGKDAFRHARRGDAVAREETKGMMTEAHKKMRRRRIRAALD